MSKVSQKQNVNSRRLDTLPGYNSQIEAEIERAYGRILNSPNSADQEYACHILAHFVGQRSPVFVKSYEKSLFGEYL